MKGVRAAKSEDREQICVLITALEETEIDRSAFFEIFEANRTDPAIHYFVYEEEGRVAGFASLYVQRLLHHTAYVAEIQELVVDRDRRGAGIGSQLFQAAKEAALDHGCIQLEVCCNKKRKPSHGFYEAQGMKNDHYKFCMFLSNES